MRIAADAVQRDVCKCITVCLHLEVVICTGLWMHQWVQAYVLFPANTTELQRNPLWEWRSWCQHCITNKAGDILEFAFCSYKMCNYKHVWLQIIVVNKIFANERDFFLLFSYSALKLVRFNFIVTVSMLSQHLLLTPFHVSPFVYPHSSFSSYTALLCLPTYSSFYIVSYPLFLLKL